jgi:hypothetical protein
MNRAARDIGSAARQLRQAFASFSSFSLDPGFAAHFA